MRRITTSSSAEEQQHQRGAVESNVQSISNSQGVISGSGRRRRKRGRRRKRPDKQMCYRCRMGGHRVSQCPHDPKGQQVAQSMDWCGTALEDEQVSSANLDAVVRTGQGGHGRGCSVRDAVESKRSEGPDHHSSARLLPSPPLALSAALLPSPSPPSHPHPSPVPLLSSPVWSETRVDSTGKDCDEHGRCCKNVDAARGHDTCW